MYPSFCIHAQLLSCVTRMAGSPPGSSVGLIPNHQLFIKAMPCLSIGDGFTAGAANANHPTGMEKKKKAVTQTQNKHIATFHSQNRVVTHPTMGRS